MTTTSTYTPLSSLAPGDQDVVHREKRVTWSDNEGKRMTLEERGNVDPTNTRKVKYEEYGRKPTNWAWVLIVFIILVIIIWLILWATNPTWVQRTDSRNRPTGAIDNGKILLWSIVIAIIIVIIFWVIGAAAAW